MDIRLRHITKIAREAGRYAAGALKKSGVGVSEYECLRIIRKNPGLNQEQLSERMSIDKAAVARMLTSLEKKGYATRRRDEEDRRSNKLYATDKALEIKFDETHAESAFYEWLLADIEPEELEAFLSVLDKLYHKSKQERRDGFIHVQEWRQEQPQNSGEDLLKNS